MTAQPEKDKGSPKSDRQIHPPAIALPKGGGAMRGIGEKFAANPVTGTGSLSVPIFTSAGRIGFGPELLLTYDSSAGNGPFGFGWNSSLPEIARKTDKGLPQYQDLVESDVFIMSGAEDLTPVLTNNSGNWKPDITKRSIDGDWYEVKRYRPRIEGIFSRIERWRNVQNGDIHWRSISRDNITTLYGKTVNSRIVDPADSRRVYRWLISSSYDDKGNAIVYEYQAENSDNVVLTQAHERNRVNSRTINHYIKRIKYGNQTSHLQESVSAAGEPDLNSMVWLFEVVFDYDEEHILSVGSDGVQAHLNKQKSWSVRQDPFSNYRPGFEIRTYRLCQRVLMFHHFPNELGAQDTLIHSTEFTYQQSPIATFLASVTQCGYKRQQNGTYLKKSLPSLDFKYSQAAIQEKVGEIDAASLENLPQGLDGVKYKWVDLDGEGLAGILSEQGGGWYYKENLGGGKFGVSQFVPEKPSLGSLNKNNWQLIDLAGDGQLDLASFIQPTPGFYERTQEMSWENFEEFEHLPNLDWMDENLRFVDLTGDGHADVLITEQDVFLWHLSLGELGFDAGQRIEQALDEEHGPRAIFADGSQSIYLADMSGDGLIDLVRIRNGEICYWPNLGYGRFGKKVTMDDAPWFDHPEQFNQSRLRVADIDGSGTTDIIYLGKNTVDVYFNQCGNRWSNVKSLSNYPQVDNLSAVMTADLFGNGIACLVWSSPLAGDAGRPMRYIDLMGGQKPHLMTGIINNLGVETRINYCASTHFYLKDKASGKAWITRLPFPVHVVKQIETYDHISKNLFITRYAYHHGYFDGDEREFRGFGMVEQWDTAEYAAFKESSDSQFNTSTNLDKSSHVPPTLTKTWFHTGIFLDRSRISNFFAGLGEPEGEYYREPGLDDQQAADLLLADTLLPTGLTTDETRQACRALKGAVLRQEIYAQDGTNQADHPYTVSERNYCVRMLQPMGSNRHAVFLTASHETLETHYERRPQDPRISHSLMLEIDDFGNVKKSVEIGYSRRQGQGTDIDFQDRSIQERQWITYTEQDTSNVVDLPDAYRAPMPCENRNYELSGYHLSPNAQRFTSKDFIDETLADPYAPIKGISEIAYEQTPTAGIKQKRLIERSRILYRCKDLSGPLAYGQIDSQGLPYESYQLAFTPGLITEVYKRTLQGQPAENLLPNPVSVMHNQGGYVDLEGDGCWWIPSGQSFYHPDPLANSNQELGYARKNFFQPHRFLDPFGGNTVLSYDPFLLLLHESEDSLKNKVTVGERKVDGQGNPQVTNGNDYRVLQPAIVTDPNGNRSAVAFDALGMVVGTVMMGKWDGNEGDSLDGFKADLSDAEITTQLNNPFANQHSILKKATTRLIYDLFAYQRTQNDPQPLPIVVYSMVRETHASELTAGQNSNVQHRFTYSDGLGREIQKKIQAEAGPLVEGGPTANPRWVGSGWTIYNNKGKPLRQYEPFFDDTHQFKFDKKIGVSPILFYDPLERVVATLHPNHSYQKVTFSPWKHISWDVNDTLNPEQSYDPSQPNTLPDHHFDPADDPDVGAYFTRLAASDYLPTWYDTRMDTGKAATAWPLVDPLTGAPKPENAVRRTMEKYAAEMAARHVSTPTISHLDSLGRMFCTVSNNGKDMSGGTQILATRLQLDLEANPRSVVDAKGRQVMRYQYNMVGDPIFQDSADAGARWMLNNIAGKPLYSWNSRGHRQKYFYDALQRTTHIFVQEGGTSEILVERLIYGEIHPQASSLNLRGKLYRHYDEAGVLVYEQYDFKGGILRHQRALAKDTKHSPDWYALANLTQPQDLINTAAAQLEPGPAYLFSNTYDALNRPRTQTQPDHSVIRYTYNQASLLEKIDVQLRGTNAWTPVVTDINYDAKGQRKKIEYAIKSANGYLPGLRSDYHYNKETYRLEKIKTNRISDNLRLQDLCYCYDPVGNIVQIHDAAQQTIFFNNQVVQPHATYKYDAIYRLIEANGREHSGQAGNNLPNHHPSWKPQYDFNDSTRTDLAHPQDGGAMRNYTRYYSYDQVGNIERVQHSAGASSSWTRYYGYDANSNRLLATSLPGDPPMGPYQATYAYDAHGNMLRMPHLPKIDWDFQDQMAQVDLEGGGKVYFSYDANGERIRKVHAHNGATREERLYLNGFEVYRKYNGDNLVLRRETLHILDGERRILLLETKTYENQAIESPESISRYQMDNHLGSACLELDIEGKIISYEEYYPYGSTSYQAVKGNLEASPKRYCYTAKERDEGTGLYYHGARYYAPWLGRWTSCDPIVLLNGMTQSFAQGENPSGLDQARTITDINLYEYTNNNPIVLIDHKGLSVELGYGCKGTYHPVDAETKLKRENAELQLNAIRKFLQTVGTAQAKELRLTGTEAQRFVTAEERALSIVEKKGHYYLHVNLRFAQENRGGHSVSWVLERLYHLSKSQARIQLITSSFVGTPHGDAWGRTFTLDKRNPSTSVAVAVRTEPKEGYTGRPLSSMGRTTIHELVIHAWRDIHFRQTKDIATTRFAETGHLARSDQSPHNWADIEADVFDYYEQQYAPFTSIYKYFRDPKASQLVKTDVLRNQLEQLRHSQEMLKKAGGVMGTYLLWKHWRKN